MPKAKAPVEEGLPSHSAAPAAGMVVADDSLTHFESVLETEGFRLTRMDAGVHAIETVEHGGLQCVLLGMQAPQVDTVAACKRIREAPGGRDTPIIILLNPDEGDTFESALAAGVDDYVTKPVRAPELIARARAARALRAAHERCERELREAQAALERVSRAQTELMSTVSHELRTRLSAILGFGQLLRRDRKHQLPERSKQYVEHIVSAAEQLDEQLDELLYLAHIQTGRTCVKLQATRLADVLSEAKDTLEALAASRGAKIELHSDPEAVVVLADRPRLVQIVTKLGSHLIQHGSSSLHILVQAAQVAHTDRVRITVASVPPGSTEPTELAEPASHDGASEAHAMQTIELVVAKQIAEMMGGRLGLETSDGQHPRYWLELPAQRLP